MSVRDNYFVNNMPSSLPPSGKTRKSLVFQKQSIDIAAALKSRKPLRKTSMATNFALEGVGLQGGGLQQQLASKLKGKKLSFEQGEG